YLYLDGSDDVLFRSLTLVITGLLALGYGFMYMQRRSMFDVQDVVIPQVFGNTVVHQQPIPEIDVVEDDDV
ncbi:MAG: hypothetical protein ACPHHS_02270, partial [Candidatus Poseidoniaceae archaeon]